jgi:predicted esterase
MAPEDAKGVYLHISPGSGGENRKDYRPVMDRLGLIYASPKDSSNDEPMLKRVKLAVDALATVKATWNIDDSRVVVGGLSGGGHMAMLTHAMFPEMFRASVSHAAQSYLPGPGGGGHFVGLTPSDLDSGELREHKWCVISGDKDFNYQEILKSSEEWEEQGFDYRFFDIPGMGHVNATPENLEKALRWIGLD